jgi:hypothetical protein
MFSKNSDPAVTGGTKSYRVPRPECAGLKVTRPELDPVSFRALIHCFASNGSIPEIEKLVTDASDRTIGQTVDLLNATFLADPGVRADSRGIVRQLKKVGRWDPVLAGFAPAFSDPYRIRAMIRLLSLGNRDPQIIQTVQAFNPEDTLAGFELLSRLVKTPAFASLSTKIQASPLTPAERDRLLEILADLFHRPTPNHSADLLIRDMSAGKSAAVWDYAFGSGSGILDSTSRFNLLLEDFNGPDGLLSISRLHHAFRSPISCWSGGKVFPDAWRNLTQELSVHAAGGDAGLLGFIGRFAPLTALAIPDLCTVPDEFLTYYPSVTRLTAGRTGGEFVGVLGRILNGGFGLSAGYFAGEWGESLAEVLKILQPKPWFGDLVLLFGELDSGDRDLFASWVSALLRDEKKWTALTATWQKSDLDPVFSDIGRIFGAAPSELASMLDAIEELFASANRHPWFEGWKKIAAESDSNGMRSLADLKSFPDAATAIGKMAADGRLGAILGDILELLAGGGANEKRTQIAAAETILKKGPRHAFVADDLRWLETPAALDDSLRACAKLDLRKTATAQWDIFQACLAGGGVDPSAFAGLQTSGAWTLGTGPSSRSFLGTFIAGWIDLPLSTADKQALLSVVSGTKAGSPAVSIGAVEEILRGLHARLAGTDGAGASRVFSVLNRFETSLGVTLATWQDFFNGVAATIADSRFVPAMTAVRALEDPALGKPGARIGPAPLPPADETAAWVRDLECEADEKQAATRSTEIGTEMNDAVLGWERPAGRLPLAWDPDLLKPRLRAFAATLTPEIRAGLFAWVGSLDPETAANWFATRSADPRLVAVMDPGTKELRVRWMTTLDRLESILVNSNFTYLVGGNYGLRFIGKFAEAWGDEPRSRWPREIQAKYTAGRTPPKLADVYAEVSQFLRAFEKIGGLPSVPSCVARGGSIGVAAGLGDSWGTAPDLLVPFSVKAKAFNLRQTLSVVAENLPGAPGANAEGMRLLRDVFWAVYASAPATERDPTKADRNPLRFFQRLGDLGGLRSISRGLGTLRFASERVALTDAFGGISHAVAEPALDSLVAKFLADPKALETFVDAATGDPKFRLGVLAARAIEWLAAERTLHVSPSLLRFGDSVSDGALPGALLADLVAQAGTPAESVGVYSPLRTFRLTDPASKAGMLSLNGLLATRVLPALGAFPVHNALALLDHDSALRSDLLDEATRWWGSRPRQSPGDGVVDSHSGGMLDIFLSPQHPEFRRLIGLWCGRSAAPLALELVSKPDEALLMVDGLLQTGDSPEFADFFASLLRELGN